MSKPLGKPIDLSRWLGPKGVAVKNRIKLVGIELEGGWNIQPRGWVHDGSVKGLLAKVTGELPSQPLEPKQVEAWIRANYPVAVNETCGMHVHQSFGEAMHYMQCMRAEYPATIIACMTDWAKRVGLPKTDPFWPRAAGKSRYCQHVYAADEQAMTVGKDFNQEREGHRYTVVNYCYARNGTAEVRLMNMMPTPDLAVSAVHEILRITNAFLVATSKREKKLPLVVTESDDVIREVFRVTA